MFDFVPLASYTPCFHYGVLILMVITVMQCFAGSVNNKDTAVANSWMGGMIAIVIILYMGLRPVSIVFGDTVNYAAGFRRMAEAGETVEWEFRGEWLFYNLMNLFAKYGDIHGFFLLCATVYVGSLWIAMRRMFGTYNFVPFLVILSMFTFWNYGVNGVRNGMGASLFILAMTYVEHLPVAVGLCLLGVGCHQSVWMMISAAVLTWFVKNSYWYLAGWLACVILSYYVGGAIQGYVAGMEFFEDNTKFTDYLTKTFEGGTGSAFRWDFLLYSSMAVFTGWYFIFKMDFEDEYFHWVYNTFLTTNAMWVLLIRAEFSNRFAQISWFIMPIVLIYPMLKRRFWENHEQMMGYSLLLFYAFTFYFNIIKG